MRSCNRIPLVPEVPESTSFRLDFLQKRTLSLNPLHLAQSMSRATPRLRSQIGMPRRPRWRWQQCEGMEQVLPMLLNLLRLLEISSVYAGRWSKMVYELRPVQSLAQPKTIPGHKISQLQMCIRHDSRMISETCRSCTHGSGFQRVPIGFLVPCTSTLSGSELKPFEIFKPSFKPND